jgi:ribosome-binding protein aMBF1 (putative translation factor)
MKAARERFFKGKRCAQCKRTDRLELDHVDPSTKIHHVVWSWSEERRSKELAKCQVLCHDCHKRKTARENSERMVGVPNTRARKLTGDEITEIYRLRNSAGWTERELAARFDVSKTTMHSILSGETYKILVDS